MQWIIMLLMGSGLTSHQCAAEAELSSGVLEEFSLRIMYEDCGYGQAMLFLAMTGIIPNHVQ
jgi:hypothetical protein